jgi:hypothetical protein
MVREPNDKAIIVAVAVACGLLMFCVTGTRNTHQHVVVCVWRASDDVFTARLADTLEKEISARAPLVLGGCGLGNQRTIYVPPVAWQQSGSSTVIIATVSISAPEMSTPVTVHTQCTENATADCARDILRRALAAWGIS